jgi:hypothetical protein
LDALAAGLNSELRFGVLPESWILRCVKSVAGLDPRKSFTEERRVTDAELTRTERALLLAIQFLQLDAGFSHEAVLPYRFPLIVLARFFDLHPRPHPRSRQLLGRWVWRGALTGQHSASSNAAVGAHLADVGRDEHQTLQRLLHRVSRPTRTPDAKTYWYGKAAVTRLYATTLLASSLSCPDRAPPTPGERRRRPLPQRPW